MRAGVAKSDGLVALGRDGVGRCGGCAGAHAIGSRHREGIGRAVGQPRDQGCTGCRAGATAEGPARAGRGRIGGDGRTPIAGGRRKGDRSLGITRRGGANGRRSRGSGDAHRVRAATAVRGHRVPCGVDDVGAAVQIDLERARAADTGDIDVDGGPAAGGDACDGAGSPCPHQREVIGGNVAHGLAEVHREGHAGVAGGWASAHRNTAHGGHDVVDRSVGGVGRRGTAPDTGRSNADVATGVADSASDNGVGCSPGPAAVGSSHGSATTKLAEIDRDAGDTTVVVPARRVVPSGGDCVADLVGAANATCTADADSSIGDSRRSCGLASHRGGGRGIAGPGPQVNHKICVVGRHRVGAAKVQLITDICVLLKYDVIRVDEATVFIQSETSSAVWVVAGVRAAGGRHLVGDLFAGRDDVIV